jgi:hypothetical protein
LFKKKQKIQIYPKKSQILWQFDYLFQIKNWKLIAKNPGEARPKSISIKNELFFHLICFCHLYRRFDVHIRKTYSRSLHFLKFNLKQINLKYSWRALTKSFFNTKKLKNFHFSWYWKHWKVFKFNYWFFWFISEKIDKISLKSKTTYKLKKSI